MFIRAIHRPYAIFVVALGLMMTVLTIASVWTGYFPLAQTLELGLIGWIMPSMVLAVSIQIYGWIHGRFDDD
jgi:hypothetical protein